MVGPLHSTVLSVESSSLHVSLCKWDVKERLRNGSGTRLGICPIWEIMVGPNVASDGVVVFSTVQGYGVAMSQNRQVDLRVTYCRSRSGAATDADDLRRKLKGRDCATVTAIADSQLCCELRGVLGLEIVRRTGHLTGRDVCLAKASRAFFGLVCVHGSRSSSIRSDLASVRDS